ncbi:hypothetical protein PENSPDRAFT_646298 [Peniophora sp. CONT]|nr:hypothetical protein PENSPDRAFT_646298 [Peniophora sp. CONT]
MTDAVKLDPEAFSREQIERVIDTATYDGRWRQRAETDPKSVVSVLGATEPDAEEGSDALADVVSVIAVVSSLAFCPQVTPEVQASSRKAWEGLVEAGVVEALCRNVTDPAMLANKAGPGQDEVAHSPYFASIDALCSATLSFDEKMNETDSRVVEVLLSQWPQMMKRIWEEPANSLKPEEAYFGERAVIPQAFIRLLVTSPATVLSTVLAPEDYTMALLARYWFYSSGEADTELCTAALNILLDSVNRPGILPNEDEEAALRNDIVTKLNSGLEMASGLQGGDLARKRLSAIADRTSALSPGVLFQELQLLSGAVEEPDVRLAIAQHTDFWRAILQVLPRAAKSSQVLDKVAAGKMLHFLGVSLHNAQAEGMDERLCLLRIWIKSGLFDALDEVVPECIPVPGASRGLSLIMIHIQDVLDDTGADSDLRQLIFEQLPRSRVVGAMLNHDAVVQQSEREEAQEEMRYSSAGWLILLTLTDEATRNTCTRRGCGKPAAAKCARCKDAVYCCAACQRSDWKEHKAVCRWAIQTKEVLLSQKLGKLGADYSELKALRKR